MHPNILPHSLFPLWFFNPPPPFDWRKKFVPKQIKTSRVSFDASQRHTIMHSIISFIPVFKGQWRLASVHTPPHQPSPGSKVTIRGDAKKGQQAPLTVRFRKAAVIYNHRVKCRLGAVIDCYCLSWRRVMEQKWKQTQSSASVMSALALYFFLT